MNIVGILYIDGSSLRLSLSSLQVYKSCMEAKGLIVAVHKWWRALIKHVYCIPVFLPEDNEDSVDIYDGLDSPFSSNGGKSLTWKFHFVLLSHSAITTNYHCNTGKVSSSDSSVQLSDFIVTVFVSFLLYHRAIITKGIAAEGINGPLRRNCHRGTAEQRDVLLGGDLPCTRCFILSVDLLQRHDPSIPKGKLETTSFAALL